MCLAVPGVITRILHETGLERTGTVNFSGVERDVNLAYVPKAKVGDYVIVHVGFALNTVDKAEAEKMIECIAEVEQLAREDGPGGIGA